MASEIVTNDPRYHGNINLVSVYSTLLGPQNGTSEYELALKVFYG